MQGQKRSRPHKRWHRAWIQHGSLSRDSLKQFRIGVERVVLEWIVFLILSDELRNFGEDVLDRFHHLQEHLLTDVGAHLFGKGRGDAAVNTHEKIVEGGSSFTHKRLPARTLLTFLGVIEELPAITTARIVYLKSQPRHRPMVTLQVPHDLLVEVTGRD